MTSTCHLDRPSTQIIYNLSAWEWRDLVYQYILTKIKIFSREGGTQDDSPGEYNFIVITIINVIL
jgi:hypothetical protein